ncbi:MAG TPA: 50S ribosomal protein L5 [Candidatus Hydrogenedentes bacterium]|nr:50S ribosomal protein L5 [Candidatus Hydrogenedentota bacterium]HIJ73793.1 50S ribosomal protein L5 [Candidatus Hydrogenedentota bacterium]
MAARLKERYRNEIVPAMREQFKYRNVMQTPKLEKIIVNVGVGDAPSDARLMENAMSELAQITGQKPSIRKARRSIAGFKVRVGAAIGCVVTLRGDRMYEFMDRLLNIAIPRIRDFRGLSKSSFDKDGNCTIGIREQTIFPEVDIDAVTRVRGMNVTFVIKNTHSVDESRELLRKFGVPFRT